MIARAVLLVAALAAPLLAACDTTPAPPATCPPSVDVVAVADSAVGTGQAASQTSTVTVMYVGRRAADGVVFDSSAVPTTFNLGGVVAGFRQGIGGRPAVGEAPAIAPMRIGGRRRIFVPTRFGYWTQPRGELLPSCTDLIFDVTLVDL